MLERPVTVISKRTFLNLKGFGVSTPPSNGSRVLISHLPNIPDHGDHIVITRSRAGNAGGLLMLGRSDGVLFVLLVLPHGRINGSADFLLGIPEEYDLDRRKFTMLSIYASVPQQRNSSSSTVSPWDRR